jgi:hypothetical protein
MKRGKREHLEERKSKRGASLGAANSSTEGTHLRTDEDLEAEVTVDGSRFRPVSGR